MITGVKKFFKRVFSWLGVYWRSIISISLVAVLSFGCLGFEIAYFKLKSDYIKLETELIWQNYYKDRYEDLKDDYYKLKNEDNDFFSRMLVSRDDAYIIERREGDGNYYYNTLTDDEKSMYRTLYKVLEEFFNGERKIATYKAGEYYLATLLASEYPAVVGFESYDKVENALIFDNPSFLWGNASVSIRREIVVKYEINKSEVVTYYALLIQKEYKDLIVQKDLIEDSIENSISELSQCINEQDTDLVKYIKIYEYVINNTKYMYDYRSEAILDEYTTSIIGILDGAENTGSICQGYARAVNYLCNYFEVECVYVCSAKIRHAFNLVCIDEEWYYSDATNGDHSYTSIVCLLGGEKPYWLSRGLEEAYPNDIYYLEVPTISQENYLISEDTYTGNLKIY